MINEVFFFSEQSGTVSCFRVPVQISPQFFFFGVANGFFNRSKGMDLFLSDATNIQATEYAHKLTLNMNLWQQIRW